MAGKGGSIKGGFDSNEIAMQILSGLDALEETGVKKAEDVGVSIGQAVRDGIVKGSKGLDTEIGKTYKQFQNFVRSMNRSADGLKLDKWKQGLGLAQSLMEDEKYAHRVLDVLKDIQATANGTEVSGLENVLREFSKDPKSLKNVRIPKVQSSEGAQVKTPKVQADPAPVVKAEEKKQDAINETTDALREQERAAESAARSRKKLNDTQNKSKTNVDINKAYDAVKYRLNFEDEYKDILKNGKEISSVLTEQRKILMQQLQPVREVATRISETASIKNIPFDSLYQEAAKVGQRLSTMYDEGTTETEEYIALQYKLINILDRVSESAGGVKGSGAKSMAQLRNWIFKSIAQDTGVDIGTSDVVDAIWGQGKFSIYDSDGKKRNMREIAAELVEYKGTSFTGGFGAEEDYNQLTKINAILKVIKENAQLTGEQVDSQQDNVQQEIDLINQKTDAQKEFNKSKQEENIVYHAGDLSNPSQTMKSLPLGNVAPSRNRDVVFNGFTGLYTTEDVDGFWGNEWDGAPISSIDLSHYKMFDARNNDLAKKAQEFFGDLNSTIYGYHRFFDFESGEMKTSTDVKTVETLYDDFKAVFKNIDLDFESFKNFIVKSKAIVEGHKFEEIEVPDIDMGVAKSNAGTVLQGVSQDVFNLDSFQTQLLKMLGFEGVDLRGTKFNGTYTGGTVIFDVKPESLKTVNEKWSDVMARNGYEIDETNLQHEEKRRQLAFDTAKAYSQQADAKSQIFEDENGQLALFEGVSSSAQKAIEDTHELEDSIKRIENLDGQMSFDDYVAESSKEQLKVEQQITAEKQKQNKLESVNNKFREYDDAVAFGYDRIQKLQKIRDGGTAGTYSTSSLLRANHDVWDIVKNNRFFSDIPEDGAQRLDKIDEVVQSVATKMLQKANLTPNDLTHQLVNIMNAAGGNFRPNGNDIAWSHFATYDDSGNKHKIQKENGLTYKVYAAFENIEDLNADIVSSIMSELTKAGFEGRLKTTTGSAYLGNQTGWIPSTDQLVVHGSSRKDQEIAYNVLRNMKTPLSYLGGGFDSPDGSFTQTLASDSIEKYIRVQSEASAEIQKLEEHVNNLGEEFKKSEQYKNNFDLLVQGIKSGSVTASKAMERMSDAYEEWANSAVGDPSESLEQTMLSLAKLTPREASRVFNNVDLSGFLNNLGIDEEQHGIFRQMFEDLLRIDKAFQDGSVSADVLNEQVEKIVNSILRLGSYTDDFADLGLKEEMQDFQKYMSNMVIRYNDGIKGEYTREDWSSLFSGSKGRFKKNVTKDVTKGIGADEIWEELVSEFPTLFNASNFDDLNIDNEKDQFKAIFRTLERVRDLYNSGWKVSKGFSDSERSSIIGNVADMYTKMGANLYADDSSAELNDEADAFKEVEQSATKAAKAKDKFAKANKNVGNSADESSDSLDDEAESLENVNRAAANLPDVSAYDSTTVRYDTNGNPYSVSGTSRQEMIDGTHVRSTDNYQFDAENNRWDYMGTVQSSERTREMVQALEEYYRILNQIQKLRLDTSNAIHTEEINKLETDDLARAYQRVCDLGIQVNDIEGQINLSVSQRQALLDVELRARQEMYDVIAKMEDKQATTATKPFQKTVADEIKKAANIDTNVRLIGDDGVSDRLQSQIADYRRLVDELVEMRLQLARNSDLTNNVDFSNRFADTAKRAENARVAIEGVFKESQKLQKLGTLITTGSKDVSNVQNLKSEMIEFANSALDGEVKINGFNKEGNLMYATLTKAGGAVENIAVALNRATGHLQAFSAGTSKATNEWEDFKTQAVQGAKNLVGMYVGFQEGVQALRTGVNYVKEIDLAMTELKKVTDETDESYRQFLEDAGRTSAIIGSTISDFAEATATFARLGYTLEESSSMAETAIIYKNVADGLDTVEESSESIISTMMAFGVEANDTMSIIDRFNAVGNNFAITSAGIGDALQRSASALFAAGNTIDESIALVTGANSVIQNPEQVGNALKTLSLRIRGVKTELEEAGLETEGMAETTAQLQAKLMALTNGKVNIMLNANEFKSTTQILREMAAVWEDMTDVQQAAALELIGGKRQANILSSLISNFETVEDVIETSMNSSGSAMAENEKWLDSIEGKTYQFTNALQTMWSNMIDSEMVKSFLDFGTGAIQILDTSAGKVIALVAALKLAAKFKGFSIGGIVKDLGDTINKITTAQNTLQTLSKTTKIGQGYDLTNVNAYAQAVSNLTAKQQANLLASKGLNQEQIRYALTLNQVDDAAMREAMAHVHATTAKQQENAVTAQSIQQKAQELAMSLRTQAATANETRAKELNVVADILENATSEEAIANNLQEATTSGAVSAALAAETTNTLGLTTAKTGLLAVTKALMIANPVGFWITVGSTILSLIPIVSDMVGAFVKSAEEIKQEATEITQAYSDAVDEINSNLKTLGITSDSSSTTTLENEFARLAEGVDRYGNNISLTSDQYERYREICEQIVGINPRIAKGYDSATEAIGNNAGVLSQLIELQKEQARLAAAEYVNDENIEILSKDAVNDFNDARKEVGQASINMREDLNALFNDILNFQDANYDNETNDDVIRYVLDKLGYDADAIQTALNTYWHQSWDEYDMNRFWADYSDKIQDNILKFDARYQSSLSSLFSNAESEFEAAEVKLEKAQDGLIDTLLVAPVSSKDYDKLTSEGKNFLVDWIKNSEMFKVNGEVDKEDVQDMRDTILDMMNIIVSDTKNIEYKGEKFTAQDIIDKIYDLNPSNVNYDSYKTRINAMLEAFWNSLSDAQKTEYGFTDFNSFKVSFGFDFETEDKEIEQAKTTVSNFLKTSTEEVQKYLDGMTAAEIRAFYSIDWNAVGDDGVNTWQDVVDEINSSKTVISDADTILSNLADTLDKIQSKYDTLQGAIDEFNECGAISGETLKSLIDNNLLQYLTFTENGLIADANAMKALEQAAINESYAMLNAAMVQDMENYALGKTEQMSALAQSAIGAAGAAAANSGAQFEQGAQGILSYASALAQIGMVDPGNLTAGLQQIYNAYQNIGNAIGKTSAYRPSDAYKSASGGGSGGSGSSSQSAKEIDWIEHYYTEIENKIDELNARLENKISNVQALDAKNTIIDQIIDLYDQKQQKLDNAIATYDARADYLFGTFSSDIQNKINNGSLDISSITDESLASNIDEYYDYIEAASQARVEAEELKQTIADLAKQKFDNISTAYENEIGLVDAYIDALHDQIDATEARGEQVGASYYESMIDSAEKRKQSLEEERNALQASLDEAVKLGQVEVGSDTWYEMVNAIYEVDSAIVEAEISMEEWQTAINDLHWENFDKLIDKLDNISDELDNIYERLTDNNEAFDENGNWTDQGIAALGMLAQKMEQAQFAAQQYADQIDKLNADYVAGKYSEEEYNEKLAELTEGQWESIEAYEAAKDEIVDLNKARVDAVKDGMQKELDAYKELIDAKKESLAADKKAHDWAKNIKEKESNILDIKRKLAALEGNTSTSAMAQKKKLQAELLKAQSELDEAYYDKSIEDQQDALDKEYESYEENQQKEIDSLEEWLDDREKILQDSFDLVKENAEVVYKELLNLSQEYGIEISDAILEPWLAGKDAIGEYKDAFLDSELNDATSAFISQLESVKDEWEEVASAAEEAADRQIAAVQRQQQETIAAYKEMQDSISTITIGSMDNVGHDDSGNGGGGAGWGGGGLAGGGIQEEVKPYSILEIFTNSLGESYNKFLNDTAADFDYKMSEAFLQNADQHNEEFKLRVPEEYKQFLQLVCDDLALSSTEGVELAESLSKVFALEDLPYHYKVFLANVVEGLVLAEEQGLEASDTLSAIFASEEVPNNYKDFLTCIIGNLNEHILDGKDITYAESENWAKNGIPSEYQSFLDSIMQGLQAPVMEGTQDANNTSAGFFGNLADIINGVFYDVESTTAGGATLASREMVQSTNNLWDNLVAWWNGVMNSLFGGGSSTHTSSSGSSHGGGGGGFADGTANADGTACANGNWGAPKTETSLVGELGPEILVRNGKWTTVGENGAEFTQVKKGDIIFNHKQSEQLLKNGHVTGRGKAYASGTWKNTSNPLDDLGEELTMCVGPNGDLQFLSKGAADMAAGTIDNLMNLVQLDTTDFLDKSRPSIGVSPSVVNTTMEFKIDASVGELIHVDHLDGNNLDEIGKFVDKAWEKKMQTLNNSIKKFTR